MSEAVRHFAGARLPPFREDDLHPRDVGRALLFACGFDAKDFPEVLQGVEGDFGAAVASYLDPAKERLGGIGLEAQAMNLIVAAYSVEYGVETEASIAGAMVRVSPGAGVDVPRTLRWPLRPAGIARVASFLGFERVRAWVRSPKQQARASGSPVVFDSAADAARAERALEELLS